MEGENRLGGSAASTADYEERRNTASNIDETVVNRPRPARNETLVKLVEQRERHDQSRGNQEPATADCRPGRRPKRPRRQETQNGVLRKVCHLSGDEMDDKQRFLGRVWKQPDDEWTNDARSVSGREAAGRSEGNKCEPGDQRQVMREKPDLARIFCAGLWQALERGGA